MRAAAAILLFAVVCLTASSLAWLRAGSAVEVLPSDVTGLVMLTELERTRAPDVVIDVAARYAGRLDLLDPRLALPTWHRHVRDEAALVHVAMRSCPPGPAKGLHDASLAKAYAWHQKTCAPGAAPAEDAIVGPPLLHPSGKSYAALAQARRSASPDQVASTWTRSHVRFFHVLELGALDPSVLDAEDRALGAIPTPAWESLTRGDRIVLTPSALLIAERGPLGLTKLKVHARKAWESFSAGRALALVPRAPSALCSRPASPELCWEPRSVAERHQRALFFGTGASAALALGASFALALAYAGERRRIHADRIHVLRTLTHELRTPATSLRLDIEPLRAAYDELPESCQEPVLRISDGIERLHRVLHRSARYMALFETKAKADSLVQPRDIPSAQVMFEELAEEWPEGVSLTKQSADAPLRLDPDWLSVAVRNLVENGARHGKPPVAVTWALTDGELVIRVADSGTSPKLSLRRAVAPYQRDEASPGLGLGLAIVDRVARLCGGRLSHEPSPTVFELRLPGGAS